MLINVKMPTIVGILTFISMINTTPESLKARKVYNFQYFRCYEQFKFVFSELSMKKSFITLGPGLIMLGKCPGSSESSLYTLSFVGFVMSWLICIIQLLGHCLATPPTGSYLH